MLTPHRNTVLLGARGENIPVDGNEQEPGSAQQHIARYFQQQHHHS
jgi:hypothetical protein